MGNVLHAAGFIGVVSTIVAGQALIVGATTRAAVAAIAQSLIAGALLVWWVVTDFWGGTNEPSSYFVVPLVGVILLDALVVTWAARAVPRQ